MAAEYNLFDCPNVDDVARQAVFARLIVRQFSVNVDAEDCQR